MVASIRYGSFKSELAYRIVLQFALRCVWCVTVLLCVLHICIYRYLYCSFPGAVSQDGDLKVKSSVERGAREKPRRRILLNQACTSLQLECTWFLRIALSTKC